MENSRCNCCSNQGNWGWVQNQGGYNSCNNSKNEGHKYCCCCWEEKEDCGYEKETKCGCSHFSNQNQGHDCVCTSKTQGYGNYSFGNTGKNSYYGW